MLKFETFSNHTECFSDCHVITEKCPNDEQDSMVFFEDLREVIFCMKEIKAYAIQMEWLAENGEISDDAPGWVSLMMCINTNPSDQILEITANKINPYSTHLICADCGHIHRSPECCFNK